MNVLARITAVIVGGLAVAGPAAAEAQLPPSELVESAARSMLEGLDADRDAYRKDPSKVGNLVEQYLLPHFDIEYSARLVLGRHWRDATPEQRQAVLDGVEKMAADIPGIKNVWTKSIRVQPRDFNAAFAIEFEDQAAADRYAKHPAHEAWNKIYQPVRAESRSQQVTN